MAFEHQNEHVAIRFGPAGVSGAAAVDGYLLCFSVSYRVTPWRDEFGDSPSTFHNFHARAELGTNRMYLGTPKAERPWLITSHANEQSSTMTFELLLPTSTIEKIEAFRLGEGFEVFLRLSGERVGAEHVTEHDEVLFRINQSQWIKVLRQMGFGSYLLCEIPIELGEDNQLRDVWASMTRARDLLYTGHYTNVVVECRKALETALVRFGAKDDVRAAAAKYQGNGDDRRSMSKRERILNLLNAANHVTHLGAHPDDNNEVVDYSRREALLVFSVTATAITELHERYQYESTER